jgi:hypothetical protein
MYLFIHHAVSIKQTYVHLSNDSLFIYIRFPALNLKNISSGFYLRNVCSELLVYIKFISNYGYYFKIIYIPKSLNTSNAETSSSNLILKYSTTNNNSTSNPLLRVMWVVSYSTNFLNSLAFMKLRLSLPVYSLLVLYNESNDSSQVYFLNTHLYITFPPTATLPNLYLPSKYPTKFLHAFLTIPRLLHIPSIKALLMSFT